MLRVRNDWQTAQLAFLKSQGLKPEHRLLDVGCGPLGAGLLFIDYLNAGNWVGVDMLDFSAQVCSIFKEADAEVAAKKPQVVISRIFDFKQPVETFDYAIAFSVFTHININQIMLCLARVADALKPGGRFFATFKPGPEMGRRYTWRDERNRLWWADQDPFCYTYDQIARNAVESGLTPTYIGDWCKHPNITQKMIQFTKGG